MQPCIIKRTKASRRTNPYNPYNPCNHYFVERRAHNRECVCMYVYLHVWMYVCVHEFLHTYICVYVYVYVYAHAGKDEDEGVVLLTAYDARREEGLLLWLNAQVPLYSHIDICICTCTHVYEYVCMYIYRYGYMDVCMCICMYVCRCVCITKPVGTPGGNVSAYSRCQPTMLTTRMRPTRTTRLTNPHDP
jgi:hypothetical protein